MRAEFSGAVVILGTVAGSGASVHAQAFSMGPRWAQRSGHIDTPVAVCFARGTDPGYVLRIEQLVQRLNAERCGVTDYQLTGRWSGSQGSPRALTWSFVPDGVSIPGGVGEPTSPSTLFASMDSKFSGRAVWIAQFEAVFSRWQTLTGITYTRVQPGANDWDDGAPWGSAGAAGARGDIRIGSHYIDASNGILAYNLLPSSGDMVLDSSEMWSQTTAGSFRFLRNTIAREHGHGIGLLSVDPVNQTKLMEPFLTTAWDGPQQDDIRGAQRHYGDRFEENDTSATAAPIGALPVPGSLTFGSIPSPAVANASLLSIDADGETDFWSFTVSSACTISATATPVGSTYLQGPQGGTVTSVNALAQADLEIAIFAANGSTVLGASSSALIGFPETVSGVALPGPGTYFVRVTESNAPTQSQLYRLSLTASGPSCYANCDGSTIVPVLNVNDFACFLNKYAAGDTTANCDNSTLPPVLNVNDFSCFLNLYAVGCP